MIYEPTKITSIKKTEDEQDGLLHPIIFHSRVDKAYDRLFLVQINKFDIRKTIILHPVMLVTNHLPWNIECEIELFNEDENEKVISSSINYIIYQILIH